MKKIFIVAKHEFWTTVRRLSFLLWALIFPLILVGLITLCFFVASKSAAEKIQEPQKMGFVDKSGLIKDKGVMFKRYDSEEEAISAMKSDDIAYFVVITKDYIRTGKIIQYSKVKRFPVFEPLPTVELPDQFKDILLESIFEDQSQEVIERVKKPFHMEYKFLDQAGKEIMEESYLKFMNRAIMGFVFFFIIFCSIAFTSGYLMQGVADEKENRVMEMVVSSVTPVELMWGKLIGLGGAGVTQALLWCLLGLIVALITGFKLVFNVVLLVLGFSLFVLGYLLIGSLMLGFGSLGTTYRESQQWAATWSIIAMSPIFFLNIFLQEPNSVIAKIFSYIPITAPTTIILRYSIDPENIGIYEIALSIFILLISIYIAIIISSRIYRVGLLLYGKRPTIREIFRWIRYS